MATLGTIAVGGRAERLLYSGLAALIVALVFAGFAPTYYLRTLNDAPALPPPPLTLTPLVHVHGLLFSSWVLFFLVQTRLVAANRVDLHRKLGIAGAVGASLMIVVGAVTALHSLARGSGVPGIDPRRFLAVPLFDLVVFAALVCAGLWARHDPQSHKRLMLLSTISLLPPAIARLPTFIESLGVAGIFGTADLCLLPVVGWDLATRGRLHRATLWGGLLMIVSVPLRLAVAGTDAWLAFAEWAVAPLK